jgi:hypothetical protein
MIGHDGNAAVRMAIPEEFDLLDDGVEVVAGVDNEEQQMAALNFATEQIIRR